MHFSLLSIDLFLHGDLFIYNVVFLIYIDHEVEQMQSTVINAFLYYQKGEILKQSFTCFKTYKWDLLKQKEMNVI